MSNVAVADELKGANAGDRPTHRRAEWKLRPLGDIADVSAGSTPNRRVAAYWNGDIPFITTTQIDFNTIEYAEQFISAEGLAHSSAKLLSPGTLLMALYGQGKTRGKVAVLGIPAATNQACAAISFDHTACVPFFFHQLAARYEEIRRYSNTGNQDNLNSSLVRAIPLHFPDRLEQEAIAKALSDVDALIGALDKLVEKKQMLKLATMQQLLTARIRLHGFRAPWRKTNLGDVIVSCSSGSTPKRDHLDYYKGTVRWITSGELNYNVITETKECISEEAVRRTNLKLIQPGTFLMAITGMEAEGTRGACAIVGAEATTNQSCMAIFPTPDLCSQYLFHYYVLNGKPLALRFCQGTKQQSYTARIVKTLPITMPTDIEEQHAIARTLSEMDADIASTERRRDKITAVKQGMMQQLLTGRIRFMQPESVA